MAIDQEKTPASRFNELPEETQAFLVQLRGEELSALRDGLRLVGAMQTVGKFMRWVIIGVGGIFIGAVLLYENYIKVLTLLSETK